MISIDTNVLVRLLTNDEPRQVQKARKALDAALLDGETLWVSHVVLCELVWVLQALYGYNKGHVGVALNAVLAFPGIDVQNSQVVKKSLKILMDSTADFADILLGLLSSEAGAAYVLTFDKKAAKLATHTLLT